MESGIAQLVQYILAGVIFEWDTNKAESILKKHGVYFGEADTVLDDDLSLTFPDTDHSDFEPHYVTIGTSSRKRLLVVVHREQGQSIRLISGRRATRSEQTFYEEA